MKEVHLTKASIPGVRCLREMKASTNKRKRDTTYTSKMIVGTAIAKEAHRSRALKWTERKWSRGNRKAIPVRTAEEVRHSIASSPEGKMKNHPAQCIPPNTTPAVDIKKIYLLLPTSLVE